MESDIHAAVNGVTKLAVDEFLNTYIGWGHNNDLPV